MPQSEVQKFSNNGTERNSSLLAPQNRHDTRPTSNNGPPPVSPRPRVKPRMVIFQSYQIICI